MKYTSNKRRSRNTRVVRRKKLGERSGFGNVSGIKVAKVTAKVSGILCIVFIAYFVFANVSEFLELSEVPVRDIRFTGLGHLSYTELLKRANISGDTNLLSLDLKEVRKRLQTEPYVKDAEVERNFYSGVLTMKLRLRKPAALLNCDGLYGIDEEGILLGEVEKITSSDLPLISGVDIETVRIGEKIKTKNMELALELLRHVSSSNLESVIMLSEINVGNLRNIVLYAGKEGVQIRLGRDRFREKLDKATAILTDLQNRGKEAEYIDFRFKKRIVVKPKK